MMGKLVHQAHYKNPNINNQYFTDHPHMQKITYSKKNLK